MILILKGRSGCGKSAIAQILKEEYGYVVVKTCTTREPREGESPDAYHFMTMNEFQERLKTDEFVEIDRYGDNLYGTLKSSLEGTDKMVAILTPEGASAVKNLFPDAFIVYICTDMKTSVMRAISREEKLDPAKMDKISTRAMQDDYLYKNQSYDFKVENTDKTSLYQVAKDISEAHEKYAIMSNMGVSVSTALKETKNVLQECIDALEEYDRTHPRN